MLTFVNTRLRGILSIKAFNKHTPEIKRYKSRSKQLFELGKKYQNIVALIKSVIPMLTYLMLAAIMWYVHSIKTDGTAFNSSALLIVILLIISFLPILRRTLSVSVTWKLGAISFEKLLNIFELESEDKLPHNCINLTKKNIYFTDVTFKYSNSNTIVFEKLNICLIPKTITVIKGRSGSGKNSFCNLLLKIYKPTKGQITFGDLNFETLSERTIRKNITVVSHNFPLYGRTVYEAIAYNRKIEREPLVINMLKDMQQFEDEENKLIFDDKIGDLGNLLTNGQKKILMYCRALLTNKHWMIIDQPFRDLNDRTIDYIKTVLNKLKNKKGIIILDTNSPKGLNVDFVYTIKNKMLIENN
jgi:ABC-type multidrug transport system fused ATPase/permease subunit